MKNIYNDLLNTYYDMEHQKIKISSDIKCLCAQREQLENDMTRLEYILAEYGTYQEAGFIENKSSDNGSGTAGKGNNYV